MELVERWDDISLYFGTHRPTAVAEVRTQPNFESHVLEDRLSRPRFAVLKYLLNISKLIQRVFVISFFFVTFWRGVWLLSGFVAAVEENGERKTAYLIVFL